MTISNVALLLLSALLAFAVDIACPFSCSPSFGALTAKEHGQFSTCSLRRKHLRIHCRQEKIGSDMTELFDSQTKNTAVKKFEKDNWQKLTRKEIFSTSATVSTIAFLFIVSVPTEPAQAIDLSSNILGAFVAYGHYLGLILAAASLTAERFLVKPGMTTEEEEKLAMADIVYGIAGILITVSGYFRITAYGKGWDFYSHEPIFWVKMILFAVMGSSSFFPTIKIIQRSVDIRALKEGKKGEIAPMSVKLASRITKVVNAELLALASIPLAATLMARGVGYAEWLPWQAGAGSFAVAFLGLGYKYIKEALEWTEDEI